MPFPAAPTVPLPTWANGGGALKTDPGVTKRALGWTRDSIGVDYGEAPPFQYVNNEAYNNGLWASYFNSVSDYLKLGNFDLGINSNNAASQNIFEGIVKIRNSLINPLTVYNTNDSSPAWQFSAKSTSISQNWICPITRPDPIIAQFLKGDSISAVTNLSWTAMSPEYIQGSLPTVAALTRLWGDYGNTVTATLTVDANNFIPFTSINVVPGKYLIGGAVVTTGTTGNVANESAYDTWLAICDTSSASPVAPASSLISKNYIKTTGTLSRSGGTTSTAVTIPLSIYITSINSTITLSLKHVVNGRYPNYSCTGTILCYRI